MMGNPVTALTVQLGERKLTLSGRKAYALDLLINAGFIGVTTLEIPAGLRWSHFIWLLRRDGFVIESPPETHGGPFAGHHSRYVLKSPVTVLDIKRQQDAGRAAA